MAFKVKRKYQSYSDPAHGWLKVKKSELERLGIANKITPFSYQKGNNAYLEEDNDLSEFAKAKQMRGEQFEIINNESNKSSKIRNYNSYINYKPEQKTKLESLKNKILTLPSKDWSVKAKNKIKGASLAELEFWAKKYGVE